VVLDLRDAVPSMLPVSNQPAQATGLVVLVFAQYLVWF
jgi:hypothetical protein